MTVWNFQQLCWFCFEFTSESFSAYCVMFVMSRERENSDVRAIG